MYIARLKFEDDSNPIKIEKRLQDLLYLYDDIIVSLKKD